MANIITVTDNRTSVSTRLIAPGDTFISPDVDISRPIMLVTVGSSYGFLDIKNASVVCTASTIKDCFLGYGVKLVSTIIPGENVDVSLVGDTTAGANITLPV